MSDDGNYQLPVGTPRPRKVQTEQLYQRCGQGLEELISEVGFALYPRCLSMLQVYETMGGIPPCPRGSAPAQMDEGPVPFARCTVCGWMCPWELCQRTYQHKGLFAGGLEPFVRDFVREFLAASLTRERMVLINALIHRFHWEGDGVADGRPGVTNLIQSKMKEVMAFLDRLSYGDDVPPELARTREEWRRKWCEKLGRIARASALRGIKRLWAGREGLPEVRQGSVGAGVGGNCPPWRDFNPWMVALALWRRKGVHPICGMWVELANEMRRICLNQACVSFSPRAGFLHKNRISGGTCWHPMTCAG